MSTYHNNTVLTVWMINKAGGLIYFKEFSSFHSQLSSNDALIIASTLQSVHAISAGILPNSGGFTHIFYERNEKEGKNAFWLYLFQTPTGLKFMLTVPAKFLDAQAFLRKVYELYVDYALKNYYYTLEMPVRSEQFDYQLLKLVNANRK